MADPFEHDVTPEPDEPNPPGVKPNAPEGSDVYGTQWGDVGGQKPKTPPDDRPDRITVPNDDAPQVSPTAPPTTP